MTQLRFLCPFAFFLALSLSSSSPNTKHPHIIFILADDLGIYAPGYVNHELKTPTLDSLAEVGVVLNDHYTYRVCAPSRGSLLTGRFPFKLSATRNNYSPSTVLDGIDLSYTFLPEKLRNASYINHHVGKWHLGFYKKEYTPTFRGFHTSNCYLLGAQEHYSQLNNQSFDYNLTICNASAPTQFYDIWLDGFDPVNNICTKMKFYNSTATSNIQMDSEEHCSNTDSELKTDLNSESLFQRETCQGLYNSYRFSYQAVDHIRTHKANYGDLPLFMYLALQNTHKPLEETPSPYMDLYSNITNTKQKILYAMISEMDDMIKNVTIALKEFDFWENTLLIWATDNGSPVKAGSNYPLKGAKSSNWEGGVRTPALVSGGYLPSIQQGKQLKGLIHLCDWYATLLSIAGLSYDDPKGVSPVDGLNMWPWISGIESKSPRQMIVHEHNLYTGYPAWGAIRVGDYKMLMGPQNQSTWYGGPENNYFSPNVSVPEPETDVVECSFREPCLYNIQQDPTEHVNIAGTQKDVLATMLEIWERLYSEYHPPTDPQEEDPNGYCDGAQRNNWYVTPWVE